MTYRTLEDLVAATASGVRPPERLTVAEAAEKYRFLNNPGSYVGYWDNAIAPYLVEPMEVLTSVDHVGMIFGGPARTGKALPLDTPLPTPTGWTTMGDLRVGDLVMGRDGRPCRVVAATDVMHNHDVYRIEFDDGTSIEADGGHKWAVETLYGSSRVVTTEDMIGDHRKPTRKGSRSRYAIPVPEPLDLPEKELPIPPYTLGVWLGDGAVQSGSLCLFSDDADEIVAGIKAEGGLVSERESGKERAREFTVKFSHGSRDTLVGRLREAGFIGVGKSQLRHIPSEYQRASIAQRRQLLRGLMDTDGTIANGGRSCEFNTSVWLLAQDVRELLCGLGIKNTIRSKTPTFRYKGELRTGRESYTVAFALDTGSDGFSLRRYRDAVDNDPTKAKPGHTKRRWIKSIEKVETTPVRCIQVDSPDSLFLAGEQMVPTHNSDMFFNWLLHTAKCDPADMMHVLMTMNVARDWSQKDLRRAFRHSPELGSQVSPGRHNQSTHDIRFLSGMHLLVKWPTITELSGKTVGRNWISDYDRIPESIDGEGNAFDLTDKRGQTFRRNRMTVAESSPGYEVETPQWVPRTPHEAPPTKGILALYNRGDRRRWYWRCPQCYQPFEPDFKLIKIPDSEDHVEAAEAAVMMCPHNGCAIWHDGKNGMPGKNELNQFTEGNAAWVKDGQIWIPAKPGDRNKLGTIEGTAFRADIASFWLKGPAAAFTTWRDLVLKYLKAEEEYARTGSQEALKTTINTDQGLPYTPKKLMEGRNWEELKERAQDLGVRVVPEGVRFLVATIDVQKYRFEVQVHGFSTGGDLTVIDRFAIKKSNREDEDGGFDRVRPATYGEDWDLLVDQVLMLTYPLADGSGRHMRIRMTACDSGGSSDKKNDSTTTKQAYDFWRRLRDSDGAKFPRGLHKKFQLIKGNPLKDSPRAKLSFPDSERKDRKAAARGEIPVLLLNVNALKDQMDVLLDRRTAGGGRINFPDWLSDEFWQELVAEVRTASGWEKRSSRNETWDLLVYAMGLALYRPIRIEQIDWDNPPRWAEEWDENEMVFQAANDEPDYPPPGEWDSDSDKSLEELAALLG